ncbi:MAG TPA: glycosyltransferase [Trebonia sp.]|nr:glycosyltransferase [Trebonia sp.]
MSPPADSRGPRLSVVIPVRDGARALDEVLSSLERQTADRGEFEVIVVDDGSAEPVALVVDKHQQIDASCVRLEIGRGRAAARNAGAERATAPRVLFLDGDSWALPSLVRRHLDFGACDKGRTTLLGRRLELGWDRLRRVMNDGQIGEGLPAHEDDLRYAHAHDVDIVDLRIHRAPWMCAYTHNMSVDRELFRSLGGFDESFVTWGHEDIELGYRLFLAHGRRGGFAYDRDAVCVHLPHFRDFAGNWRMGERNLERVKRKHPFFDVELLGSEVNGGIEQKIAHYESALQLACLHGLGASAADVSARIPALRGKRRLLWIGAGLGLPDNQTRYDHALPASATNLHLLGIDTPHDDATFEAVVNIDLWRQYTVPDLSLAIIEGLRIAPELFLVQTAVPSGTDNTLLRRGAWDPAWIADSFGSSFPASVIHHDETVTVIRFQSRHSA